jgi:phospholipase D1/2
VVLPVTLLVAATAAVLDPVSGFAYALAGSLLSATVNFGLGRLLGRDFVRTLAGRRLNRLSRRLAKKGFVAVLVVRMLPVAPFTIVNLVAGA